jgi:hypothetical protein
VITSRENIYPVGKKKNREGGDGRLARLRRLARLIRKV